MLVAQVGCVSVSPFVHELKVHFKETEEFLPSFGALNLKKVDTMILIRVLDYVPKCNNISKNVLIQRV